MKGTTITKAGWLAAASLAAALSVGCASTPPPPNDALHSAEMSIKQAEAVQAEQYAPVEMRAAREKFQMAKSTAENKDADKDDMIAAQRAAMEAKSDADLASARAQAAIAIASADEMNKSINSLREEAQANTGGTQ
jgi:hypothetical protein